MRVIIEPDSQSASRRAARFVADLVRRKPDCVLGLATGSTPLATYGELIRLHREEGLDFSQVTTFNLDEYVGLAPSHPQSYRAFMQQNLFNQLNLDPSRTHVPDGRALDFEKHCRQYEQRIKDAGGIDLQILGIGRTKARQIAAKLGIPSERRVQDLTDQEVLHLRETIDADHMVEGDLRRDTAMNIKRLMDIGSYRGTRHRRGLPVRGQRTHTNARTKKGPRRAIAGKKKVTK